jgi:hypothetical protein
MSIQIEGLTETLRAVSGLEADLRRTANGQLRQAAGEIAAQGVGLVRSSAAACGVPAAPLVASTARVKSDRLPSIQIGGPRKVGRYGAPAAALLWGTEHGGHNFAAGASSGYWIKPAVDRLKAGPAVEAYKRAVAAILARWGLL